MPADPANGDKPPAQTISLAGGIASLQMGNLTAWRTHSFARSWFEDARREAKDATRDARRREVLFAVSAAESFLFEWVRDDVLARDFARLEQFFPEGEARGIRDKWKSISKQLAESKITAGVPDFGGRTWQRFSILVEFRNGLLHARASRPLTSEMSKGMKPLPTVEDLDNMAAGDALRAVSDLIRELVLAAGGSQPSWLVEE